MDVLIKHLVSIAWRTIAMFAVIIVNLAVYMRTGYSMDTLTIIVVGIVAGEVTKFLNTWVTGKKEVTFLASKKKK